jgi:predicted HTH domain antitoxin
MLAPPYNPSAMTLFIPDDILTEAGLSEREALIEFACRLYDAGKLPKEAATRLCGLARTAFERELHLRGLPLYHTSVEEYRQDRASLRSKAS